jgi:hypothetical protein
MILSILIPTVPQRKHLFDGLVNHINNQINALNLQHEIEVVSHAAPNGTMTTGAKRNILVQMARGTYVWHIDDDDLISETAIADVVNALQTAPDALAINGTWTENGRKLTRWFISKDNPYCAAIVDGVEVFLRHPNHITPMKREISVQVPFNDISNMEDYYFSMKLKELQLIKTEVKIEKPIYEYRYSTHDKLY